MESPKIIHIPYNSNPYQTLLLDNLKAFGLSVKIGRIVRFPHLGDISVLSNIINNSKVNILHLHWQHQFLLGPTKFRTILRSLSFICQILLIKTCGKKFVWTVHNLKNHEGKHEALEMFFSSILARLADVIIAHCESAKQKISETYRLKNPHKIVVIPHGNYLGVYDNSISINEARNRLDLSANDLAFVFLGKMRSYKGTFELIDAFLRLDCDNIKLILAGSVDDQSLLKMLYEKIKDRSEIRLMPGYISDSDIQTYMNAADIMVLPYRDVLTSGAAILGMSFGKAIIAPRIGCLSDILDNSGSFLYDPNERNGLLDAMTQAVNFRSRVPKMANHNFTLAHRFNWQTIAEATYCAYMSCLSKQSFARKSGIERSAQ